MTRELTELAADLVDGHEPDWTALDEDTARRLKRVHQVSQAFARARAESTEAGACQFNWCHLEVFELIGSGGFGEVYRAWDPVLKREVALKLRSADARAASDQVMMEEARRMARVRHPHVLAVHGADIDDGRAGIWCDLLDGQTLEQALVGEGALDLRRFLRLAVPLAGAVAEIHRRGLVHGDIKAANVMLQPDRTPVLMDFGAGADLSDGDVGVVAGSPLIMAPENLAGEPLSTAGDIYSLGVLFFRLVAGRYPLAAKDVEQLANLHKDEAEIDWRGVPGPILSMLRAMLQRDPADRPSADEVELKLAELRSRPDRRRKTFAWAAAVLALAAGATVAGLAYLQARKSADEALAAQVESEYSLQFLQSILSSPRALGRGSDVKVVEVLDDARRELEFAPPDSAQRRAAMSLVLGQTYSMLGETRVAQRLLNQAVALYEQEGNLEEDHVYSLIAAARNAVRGGETDEARRLLEAVDAKAGKREQHPYRLHLAQSWGDYWSLVKDDERAISAYREALALSELQDQASLAPANIRLDLATLVMRSDIEEAEQLARDARAWIIDLAGPKSEAIFKSNNSLAAVLIEKGAFEEAEALLRESLALASERRPGGSWESITVMSTLSSVLDRRGRAEEAFAVNERALELAERLDYTPTRTLAMRLNHAVRLQELGRLEEAEAGYRRLLEESVALTGPNSQYSLLARSNLADVLLVAGKPAQAEQAAREATEFNRRVAGDEHLFTLFTMDILGASQCRQGRCAEAVPMLRQVYDAKTRNFGADNPYTHDTGFFLAEALLETGNTAEARTLLEAVVAKRSADLGAEHKKTREAAALLSQAIATEGA